MADELEEPVIYKLKDNICDLEQLQDKLEQMAEGAKDKKCILEYPAVYIHSRKDNSNKYDVYVGESNQVFTRTHEHFDAMSNPNSWQYQLIGPGDAILYLIGHPHFNKSLTLDVENRLMQYLSASESVGHLRNRRVNEQSDYYTSEQFLGIFAKIWEKLHHQDKKTFPDSASIENSAIFKSSPFHKLTEDQITAKNNIEYIVRHAVSTGQNGQLVFIEGESGTGKTVLNSTIFYDLSMQTVSEDDDKKAYNCCLVVNHDEQLKVYRDIANKLEIIGKEENFICKPTVLINKYFKKDQQIKESTIDVIFVDEAHLLWSQGHQAYQRHNQIEDLRKLAKVVVLMFDQRQVMHTNDYWDPKYIEELKGEAKDTAARTGVSNYYKLTNQMRILGSEETLKWITDFTDKHIINPIPEDNDYEIRIFDSPLELEKAINEKAKDNKSSLSRMIATFDWPYKDGKLNPETNKPWMVKIGNWEKPWNKQKKGVRNIRELSWAEQEQTIGEIGSTFTIQGSDLNYAGIILGPSVSFDGENIVFIPENSADRKKKNNRTMQDGSKVNLAKIFIDNEVNVLMKRGVNGLYIFAVDPKLRQALQKAASK